MDVAALASWLGLSEKTVRSRVDRRLLPFHRWSGRLVFLRAEVTDYFKHLPGCSVDADTSGRRFVAEQPRTQDRVRNRTRTKTLVGEFLRDEVMSHRRRARKWLLHAHCTHHDDLLDAPCFTRFDNPDRAIEIDEQRFVTACFSA